MSEIMASLSAAERGLFDNAQFWVVLIVVGLTVLGSIVKKIKEWQQGGTQADTKPPPGRAPSWPRPPQPPQRARPSSGSAGPTPRRATATPTAREARPVRPAPGRAPLPAAPHGRGPVWTAEPIRAATPSPPVARRAVAEPERGRVGIGVEPRFAVPAAPEKAGVGRRVPDSGPPAGAVRAKLDQMLQDRAGLQAAFVLSEILASPVGLRDEHLG